jgi:RNA polymerase sigma factor (sigma-70 family)
VPDAVSISATSLTAIRAVSLDVTRDAPPPPVVALTRRLAAGEEAAFREFHALYFDRLHGFLLMVTRGNVHAAQDALQETLLRVVRHAREFDDEHIFWSWLKVVARNAARDGGRKQRRYLAVLEKFTFWRREVTELNGASDDDDLRALIDEGLADLDAADRRLIEGKYLRGATVIELAAASGLTEKAVESRLVRLRRQLAATLLEKFRHR